MFEKVKELMGEWVVVGIRLYLKYFIIFNRVVSRVGAFGILIV